MAAITREEWAVVRLVTTRTQEQVRRLLFTTVTELAEGRPIPTGLSCFDHHKIGESDEVLHFRRLILPKESAIAWYRSLGGQGSRTPAAHQEADCPDFDGVPILVPTLEEIQPWPKLGLPIKEELLSTRHGRNGIDPAPFMGSVPGRLHRRFGNPAGLESFLRNPGAQAFVARYMHVNLADYQEYLGSAVFISPDPVVRQIDTFMVPAAEGKGERIVYRLVPRPGQTLEGVRITAFDEESNLLTSFETFEVPADGILDVEKGVCMGQYGFVMTHDRHGVLAFHPWTGFVRQVNLSIHVPSPRVLNVSVPLNGSQNSPQKFYRAAAGSEIASTSVIGEVRSPSAGVRVAEQRMRRERRAEAEHYGQRWFPAGSRAEAVDFLQHLLGGARAQVMIADPYLAGLQLAQFLYKLHGSHLSATLMTTKDAFKPDRPKSRLDAAKGFKEELERLYELQRLRTDAYVISPSSLHDRFMVIDAEVWLLGSSLNNFGEKATLVVRLPNPDEIIEKLKGLIAEARSIDAYIDEVSAGGAGQDA